MRDFKVSGRRKVHRETRDDEAEWRNSRNRTHRKGFWGGVNEMEPKEDLGFGNDRQTLSWPEM